MLVSGGKIIAIDKVNHDNTLSGDGVFKPLGVNKDLLNRAVYFSDTNPSPYFTWNGNTLSANSAVKFFNVSYTYNVNPPESACVDFVYSGTMSVNGVSANHFIEGYKANETHNLSYNFLNNAPNFQYTFVHNSDDKCSVSKVKVSCIGFIYDDSEPEPTEIVNALARENNDIIIFNNNDIALRV